MELVLTSYRHRGADLIQELKDLGRFERTVFRDVIKGEVENLENFLEELEGRTVFYLSRLTPIEKSFRFSPLRVIEEFEYAVKPIVKKIEKGESFCVRVNRRGLKGMFSSQEVAKEIGSFILNTLMERHRLKPKVDLNDPDRAVVFETLGNWGGIGLISKHERRKYYYLKLK